MRSDRMGRVRGVLSVLVGVVSVLEMVDDVKLVYIITLFASGLATGIELKGALDERRLRNAGLDPALLHNPLRKRLRALIRGTRNQENG